MARSVHPGFPIVKYSLGGMKRAIMEDTVRLLLKPIKRSGNCPSPEGYFAGGRQGTLQHENNVLLIVDEIQSALAAAANFSRLNMKISIPTW